MDSSLFVRPEGAYTTIVRERPRVAVPAPLAVPKLITVDKSTECHVTPLSVGQKMVSYLGNITGPAFEPEGGTGNLIQCLLEAGCPAGHITSVEKDVTLYQAIRDRFDCFQDMNLVNDCFL